MQGSETASRGPGDRSDLDRLWLAVLGYSGSPAVATAVRDAIVSEGSADGRLIVDGPLLTRVFDRADRVVADGSSSPGAGVQLLSRHGPAVDRVLDELQAVPAAERRAVLAHHLVGLPVPSSDDGFSDEGFSDEGFLADLARGERLLTGSAPVLAAVAPLLDLDPPASSTPSRLPAVVVAGAALIGLGVAALLLDTDGRAAAPVVFETSTTTSIAAPPPTAARFFEPGRLIDLTVTDEDTVVRTEPLTGERVWESQPFAEPLVVDINFDVITIESSGRRLFLNLHDGTLLPP